jgi:hypothetical protein
LSAFEELRNKRRHLETAHRCAVSADISEELTQLLRDTDGQVETLNKEFQKYNFNTGNKDSSIVDQPLELHHEQDAASFPQGSFRQKNEPGPECSPADVGDESLKQCNLFDDQQRWYQFTHLIDSASKCIRSVVEVSFHLMHSKILKLHETAVSFSPIQSEWQTFDGKFFDQYNHIQLLALEFLMCHSSFERDHLNEDSFARLQAEASLFQFPWKNSNAAVWHDKEKGPFEMAKLFCRSLGPRAQVVRKFSELDILSLLRMMVRCSFFSFPLSATNSSLSFSSKSFFVDECVVRRKTARACLRAVKLWQVFECGTSQFSETDFLHASISFDDLVTQINHCSHLREKVDVYIITPFKSSDHFSLQSSSVGTELAPALRVFRGSSSISSSTDTLEQQQELEILDAMLADQAREDFVKAAFEETQSSLRNTLLTAAQQNPSDISMRTLFALSKTSAGALPFVRIVMRKLQRRVKASLLAQAKEVDCSGCSVFDEGPMQLSVTSLSPDGVFTVHADIPHCFDQTNPLRMEHPIAVAFASVPPSLADAGVVEGTTV